MKKIVLLLVIVVSVSFAQNITPNVVLSSYSEGTSPKLFIYEIKKEMIAHNWTVYDKVSDIEYGFYVAVHSVEMKNVCSSVMNTYAIHITVIMGSTKVPFTTWSSWYGDDAYDKAAKIAVTDIESMFNGILDELEKE